MDAFLTVTALLHMFLAMIWMLHMFLAMIWTRRTWVNLFIKCVFLGMTGWSTFLLLTSLGYLVKI